MKKSLLSLAIIIGLIGCKKDPCKDVSCLNGGVCVDGSCQCELGFEGPNCETEQRLAFVGEYAVEEACNLGDFSYTIEIIASPDDIRKVTITNFADFGLDVDALVDGTTIEIPSQMVDNKTLSGSGELVSDLLNIEYTLVPDSGQTLICNLFGVNQ